MRVVKINSTNGRNVVYIRGDPTLKVLNRQDYEMLISQLEAEIRDYFKDKPETDSSSRPP